MSAARRTSQPAHPRATPRRAAPLIEVVCGRARVAAALAPLFVAAALSTTAQAQVLGFPEYPSVETQAIAPAETPRRDDRASGDADAASDPDAADCFWGRHFDDTVLLCRDPSGQSRYVEVDRRPINAPQPAGALPYEPVEPPDPVARERAFDGPVVIYRPERRHRRPHWERRHFRPRIGVFIGKGFRHRHHWGGFGYHRRH